MTDVRVYVESVTPALAQALLANMAVNRTLRPARVQALSEAMKAGMYNGLNGETIVVDDAGKLIDGQHRLNAVIESGLTSVRMLIACGVSPTSGDTIDQGLIRSPGDVLAMHGHQYSYALAAAARWLWVYENDWPNGIRSRGASKATTQHLLKVIKANPELELAVGEFSAAYHKAGRLLTGSVAGFSRLVTDRLSSADSDEFFNVLCTGEGTQRSKVVRLLRDRLMSRTTKSGRLNASEVVALTVRVWNAFREGRDLTRLYVGKSQENPFEFVPRFL